jgi:hypothetical protein
MRMAEEGLFSQKDRKDHEDNLFDIKEHTTSELPAGKMGNALAASPFLDPSPAIAEDLTWSHFRSVTRTPPLPEIRGSDLGFGGRLLGNEANISLKNLLPGYEIDL